MAKSLQKYVDARRRQPGVGRGHVTIHRGGDPQSERAWPGFELADLAVALASQAPHLLRVLDAADARLCALPVRRVLEFVPADENALGHRHV